MNFKKLLGAGLAITFICHMMVVCLGLVLREEGPKHEILLTTQPNSILLYGKNSMGMMALRVFDNWGKLNNYLLEKQLKFEPVNDVSILQNSDAHIHFFQNNHTKITHQIKWSKLKGDTRSLMTPDRASAIKFLTHVRYNSIRPAHFGYSIKVLPR